MFGMEPEIQMYYAEKERKQAFLQEEIANKNYDLVAFAQYLDSKKRK
jgi:hypothetical protein